MDLILNARKLADFIANLQYFEISSIESEYYDHMGALLVDITLQSGLNYNSVVKPRVERILLHYCDANTTTKFNILVQEAGIGNLIQWKNDVKINRLKRVIEFALEHEIDTCTELKKFLLYPKNQSKFLQLNGIGKKTLDYTLKLLNFDTVAVDRHIYSFVKMANIKTADYTYTKKIVEYAADFLDISRSSMDYSIWKYMSEKPKKTQLKTQLVLPL